MTKNKQFSKGFKKSNIKALREYLEYAITKYSFNEGVDLGIEVTLGNCSFEEGEATFKLNVVAEGVMTREEKAVGQHTDFEYGKLITDFKGVTYKLIGYKTRSPKKPIVLQDILTGETYKASVDWLNENTTTKEKL